VVFNEWSEIFPGFQERILPGAIEPTGVVKSYFNHDPSQVLSTLESDPPLEIIESADGLSYSSPIPPTSYGKDLAVNLQRGNVKGSSFAFFVPDGGDRMWEDSGTIYREVNKLLLYELGPVTDPAYIKTTAQVRSAKEALEQWRAEQTSKPPVQRELRKKRLQLSTLD
jgi:HK97 family phage prohead protease